MKLIIDIPEKIVTAIQNGQDYRYDIHTAIAQGEPYDTSGDLISREALKKAIEQGEGFSWDSYGKDDLCVRKKYIDNAPTVSFVISQDYVIELQNINKELIKQLEEAERPQGDCENCDYRKFTETFVDGVVEVMNKNGITSVEELEQIVRGDKNV